MKSQIDQWGNSLAFRIPKLMVQELHLKPNDAVSCHIENGKLVIEPIREILEYTLDELLARDIDQGEEVSWGKPEGEEAW
ncbi:MAG: AbrB/MazE/SpoVT family DNA-binding domain-containing protein [Chroococcidiopsidaceae cyanobacterium CP_BM_RX_35]|nr:AbrB/MazE/SpoVT family DNA-binding domain-containing protein [Chroococcidiopsidaceae cyanobacterium CP_BM_RX_35]